MLDGAGITDLFSRIGGSANTKVLILGSSGHSHDYLMNQVRSLNLEHVSPTALVAQEISRRTPLGQKAERAIRSDQPLMDETILSIMRRWFWARKPDAGFVLSEFPATLLQARVLDEWLEARGENLDAVVADDCAASPLVEYYKVHGLLNGTTAAAAQ